MPITDPHFAALWKNVADQFLLSKTSDHGPDHWSRVLRNAHHLAEHEKCDRSVLPYFALFHDACRVNEWDDHEHGPRGAELAQRYFDQGNIPLSHTSFQTLLEACRVHTIATYVDDPTIAVCLDADRLDLGRVGIAPDPKLLFTATGISIASRRAFDELGPEPNRVL